MTTWVDFDILVGVEKRKMFDCENKPIVDFKESEFKKGDVIIRINGHIPAKILRVDEHHYCVRWMVGGDSMLWIEDVDKEYVKVN